jgi:predicted nucleotidyltransferase
MDFEAERRAHVERLRREVPRLTEELRARGATLIVLFGSMSRNEEGLFSDADLLVVMESNLPYIKRSALLYEQLKPWCADLFIYTPEELDRIKEHNPLVRSALSQGRILYEKQ